MKFKKKEEFASFFNFGHYILLYRFIFLPAMFMNFGHGKFRGFVSFFSAAGIDCLLNDWGVVCPYKVDNFNFPEEAGDCGRRNFVKIRNHSFGSDNLFFDPPKIEIPFSASASRDCPAKWSLSFPQTIRQLM